MFYANINIYSKLLWRFAPIFYSIFCKHLLVLQHQTIKKKVRRFNNIFFVDFFLQTLQKLKKCWRQSFVILSTYKPSLGSRDVPQKMWAGSVQLVRRSAVLMFIGHKQTNTPTSKMYINVNQIIYYIVCYCAAHCTLYSENIIN